MLCEDVEGVSRKGGYLLAKGRGHAAQTKAVLRRCETRQRPLVDRPGRVALLDVSENAGAGAPEARRTGDELAGEVKSRLTVAMRRMVLIGVLVLGWTAIADAEPVLHEFFDFSGRSVPATRSLHGTSRAGGEASGEGAGPQDAANRSGQALPSDPAEANGAVIAAEPSDERAANGESPAQSNRGEGDTGRYRLDGNTSTPSLVGYSDPFSPSIPPFKRLFAYDSVNDKLELVVARETLAQVGIGGAARPADDQFFAEVKVDVAGDKPVRLPTVGAGFRVLSAKASPERQFSLLQDGAENLFVKGLPSGKVTWTAHFAIDRRVFGSPFPEVHWSTLRTHLPELPPIVATAAAPILAKVGVTTSQRPAQALRRLVQYFRSFSPEQKVFASTGVQLYHDIALSQQGVCRHRSFAFVVTALALGLPSRFVRNEAHAWVEVFDGKLWHRVDLGGAASEVALSGELNSPHQPPADPYAWPSTGESGQSMMARALGAGGGGGSSGGQRASGGDRSQGANPTAASAQSERAPGAEDQPSASGPPMAQNAPEGSEAPDAEDDPPVPTEEQHPTTLKVQFGGATLKRGERFSLSGTAKQSTGDGCALLRIEVQLVEQRTRATFGIGTLVTDDKGRYGGELVVPNRVPVGDYRVSVKSPGNQLCAAATAE